ncbi:MAG: ABC transporter substrate binding protein [Syntrophaceae bacterium]
MRKVCTVLLGLLLLTWPCMAAPYQIEVLQVGDVEAFGIVMQSTIKELGRLGLVQGQNVNIRRTIIKADMLQGAGNEVEIQDRADRIIAARPDLVLTIGTPATKALKDKAVAARIPVVFSCVYAPLLVGSASLTQAGPGFTGVSIYVDPADVLNVVRLAFPGLKTLGIVHSEDENVLAFVNDAKIKGRNLKINVLTRQVRKTDKLTPAACELIAQGAQAFLVPADVYYGMRDLEPVRELIAIEREKKLPVISCAIARPKDAHVAVLLVTPSFQVIGELTARQIAKILLRGRKPETLPILRQEHMHVQVDTRVAKSLGLTLPNQLLMMAQPRE